MATRETVAAQVHALHVEVQQMHELLRRLAAHVDVEVAAPPVHVQREDGAVFVPGTGWTGVTATGVEVTKSERGAPVVRLAVDEEAS